ncbi:unnamed protein product, partial [Owenia fusiformis]
MAGRLLILALAFLTVNGKNTCEHLKLSGMSLYFNGIYGNRNTPHGQMPTYAHIDVKDTFLYYSVDESKWMIDDDFVDSHVFAHSATTSTSNPVLSNSWTAAVATWKNQPDARFKCLDS